MSHNRDPAMGPVILSTGPSLASEALDDARSRGAQVVQAPGKGETTVLIRLAAEHRIDALLVRQGRIDAALMDASPRLRLIVKHGVGTDNIDLAAAAARGLRVLTTRGANARSVAEHALGLLIAVARGTARLDVRMRGGHWDKVGATGREIAGMAVGLVGFGDIGRGLARLLEPFDVSLRVFDPLLPDAAPIPAGAVRDPTLKALLSGSDVVSLHCPLTTQTRHLIGCDALAAMRPGSILINTARGGLVDTAALVTALTSGHLAGAGLDTFETEPIVPDDPAIRALCDNPAVVLTPHVGGNTREALVRTGREAIRLALDALAERP